MRVRLLIIWSVVLFFAVAGALQAAPLRVVTSFSIPADWVRELGGAHVEVVSLAPFGADPHAYQPTPADMRKLNAADLIVGIAPDFETWFTALVGTDALRKKTVYLAPVPSQKTAQGNGTDGTDAALEGDPHVWMDPLLVATMTGTLAGRLAQADPPNATAYAAAAARYTAALRELDAWARETLASVPSERRVLLTHHDNLRRLAARYQLRFAAAVLGSTSTEAPDPSARQLSGFIRLAKRTRVPVFYDNTASGSLVETVTREAALPPPVRLYTDALMAPAHPASTYLGMYRENIRLIAAALR
ncbi:MAG: zinc ABC transporter substrate-binding protein [Puniceicoccales bacterium]|nr:zinc ABC transporter substrate-binding protein [Puniceicoccales bacterium]